MGVQIAIWIFLSQQNHLKKSAFYLVAPCEQAIHYMELNSQYLEREKAFLTFFNN